MTQRPPSGVGAGPPVDAPRRTGEPGYTEPVGTLPPGFAGLAWSGERTTLGCVAYGTHVRLASVSPARRWRHDDLAALAAAAGTLEQSSLLDRDLAAVASRLDADLARAAAGAAMSGVLLELDGSGDATFVAADCPPPLRISAAGDVLAAGLPRDGRDEPFGRTAVPGGRAATRAGLAPGEGFLLLSWQAQAMLTEREIRDVVATCARPDHGRPAVGLAVGALWAMAASRADRRTAAGLSVIAIARERYPRTGPAEGSGPPTASPVRLPDDAADRAAIDRPRALRAAPR